MKQMTAISIFTAGIILAAAGFFGVATAMAQSASVGATVSEVCGNAQVGGAEQCDDGNTTSGDGCSATCTTESSTPSSGGGGPAVSPAPPAPFCGDGAQNADGEECDDGNTTSGDGCSAVCQVEGICGNRVVNVGETCDDGNRRNLDGCSATCQVELCGNGVLNDAEECDDGNRVNTDSCSNLCLRPLCGNGMQNSGEFCDDGNTTNGDGCTATCQAEDVVCAQQWANYSARMSYSLELQEKLRLGEDVPEGVYCVTMPGPECDDYLYDNYRSLTLEFGSLNYAINTWITRWGYRAYIFNMDRQRNLGAPNEPQCVSVSSDIPACANGLRELGEECDDGNFANRDGCSNRCQLEVTIDIEKCGSGFLSPTEQCDDGNTQNGDGCSAACTTELPPLVCGNGIREASEQCDDGNTNDFDGCSSTCTLQDLSCFEQWTAYNFSRSGLTTRISQFNAGQGAEGTFCAAAVPDTNCDWLLDGNRGYLPDAALTCSGGQENCTEFSISSADWMVGLAQLRALPQPYCVTLSRGVAECGNSVIETPEQCDDGNQTGNDGCSAVCQSELLPPLEVILPTTIEDVLGPIGAGEGQTLQRVLLNFIIAKGTLPVRLIADTLHTIPNDVVDVVIPESVFTGITVDQITLRQGENISVFVYNPTAGIYVGRFTAPTPGDWPVVVSAEYGSDITERVAFMLHVHALGSVIDEASRAPLAGVSIELLDSRTGAPWNAVVFGQNNPQVVDGAYAFLVPNGSYILVARKSEYFVRRTFSFQVTNHVINMPVALIAEPLPLEELFDPTLTVQENTTNAVRALTEQVAVRTKLLLQRGKDVQQKVEEIKENPQVQEANKRVFAPATIGVTVATVLPSLADVIIPLFRYVFLQPILLVGQRKRRGWGQIYNSLTRLPVDLALVRLVDQKTHRVIQSRVTDLQGRYVFIVEPGEYMIEVSKQGFQFPSSLLKGVKTDGRMLDIYHGEPVSVTTVGSIITPNIPLDPAGAEKTPGRIVFERYLRVTQHVISIVGIVLTAVSLYITPAWYIALFLAIHLELYGLFLRHVKPKTPKGWGIVYDGETKQPLGRAVARLFTRQYNKLVSSQVTDGSGRYAFLVGPNDYYLTFEKEGYEETKLDSTVPADQEREFINTDVTMKRKGTPPPSAPPPSSPLKPQQ